jgi:hypothetical protein
VVAVAGACVTVVAVDWDVVAEDWDEVALDVAAGVAVALVALVVLAAPAAAVVPGIVNAPMAAKRAVAAVAAPAETTVKRRRSRSPASRLLGVGVASDLFTRARMGGLAPGFLRAGWESPVKTWTVWQVLVNADGRGQCGAWPAISGKGIAVPASGPESDSAGG